MNAKTETLTLFCSSCLLGKKCLYHGWLATFALPALRDFEAHGFRIVDACPEMLGGLTCPRRPSYVFGDRVRQSVGRGRDVTAEFTLGARLALEVLKAARPVAAALLLKDSPSCDPEFGIFGRQAARLVRVVACKRGLEWEAELRRILQILPPQRNLFQQRPNRPPRTGSPNHPSALPSPSPPARPSARCRG